MEIPSLEKIKVAHKEELEGWYRWIVPHTQDEENILQAVVLRGQKIGVFDGTFRQRSRRATAIHEAGHAVVAVKSDVPVGLVRLVSDEEGFCQYASNPTSETEIENRIVCALAGQWAEAHLAGQLRAYRRMCSKTDDNHVAQFLEQRCAGKTATFHEQKYQELAGRTVEMIEEHENGIRRVAEELQLVGQLTGAQLKQLI
jgi:hypothetical protein